MERLVLEFVVRTALIAAAAVVVLLVLRIRTAAAQHAIWTGVLSLMLALPVLILWAPKFAVQVLPSTDAHYVPRDWARYAAASSTPATQAVEEPPTAGHAPAWNWNGVWLVTYGLGAGVLLLRLAIGTIRADGLKSADCAAPVTVGLFRPRVILPEGWKQWPAGQLAAVLTHERAHASRHDPLVQWLALFNRALFWFHPLAWWLERQLSALAEEACDAAVLQQGHDPGDYSTYLLELARTVQRSGVRVNVTGMAMPGSHLPQRIRNIMAGLTISRVSPAKMAGAVIACAICSAVFAAGKLEPMPQVQLPPLTSPALVSNMISTPATKSKLPPAVLLAQTPVAAAEKVPPQLRFEVASIRASDGKRGRPSFESDPGGGIHAANVTLKLLIQMAYDIRPEQLSGGPGWTDSEEYTVVAKAPEASRGLSPSAQQALARKRLQALLSDRFHLALEHETNPARGYVLTVDKKGLKMTVANDPKSPQMRQVKRWEIHAEDIGIPLLVRYLGTHLRATVVDRTGLDGRYSFQLDWTPVPLPNSIASLDGLPEESLIPAVQEQLGLKLERQSVPTDRYTIERAEKPTDN